MCFLLITYLILSAGNRKNRRRGSEKERWDEKSDCHKEKKIREEKQNDLVLWWPEMFPAALGSASKIIFFSPAAASCPRGCIFNTGCQNINVTVLTPVEGVVLIFVKISQTGESCASKRSVLSVLRESSAVRKQKEWISSLSSVPISHWQSHWNRRYHTQATGYLCLCARLCSTAYAEQPLNAWGICEATL